MNTYKLSIAIKIPDWFTSLIPETQLQSCAILSPENYSPLQGEQETNLWTEYPKINRFLQILIYKKADWACLRRYTENSSYKNTTGTFRVFYVVNTEKFVNMILVWKRKKTILLKFFFFYHKLSHTRRFNFIVASLKSQ